MILDEAPQMMTDVLAYIESKGGMDKVISLIFNNSYVRTYGKGVTLQSSEINRGLGLFEFIEDDGYGAKFISTKSVVYLEGITFAAPGHEKDHIDWRYVRP